jgi:hypothetical protein
MRPVIHECPICGEALGRFHSLSPEQLRFAETFIRCEGKINRVEEELGISYPTVRARLHELIRAMGYEVKEEPPPARKPIDRQEILAELARGAVTAEEAARKLAGQQD